MHQERAVAHAGRAAYYATSDPARARRHGQWARKHVEFHFGTKGSNDDDDDDEPDTRDPIDKAWGTVDKADRLRAEQVHRRYELQQNSHVGKRRLEQDLYVLDRHYGPRRAAPAPWPALDMALDRARLSARALQERSDGVAVLIDATPRAPASLAAYLEREQAATRRQTSIERASMDRGPNLFHPISEAPSANWAKASAATSSGADVEITDANPRRMSFDACVICLVNVPTLAPPCGHLAYCHGCMATFLRGKDSAKCTICRVPFVRDDVRVVYSFGGT